MKAYNLCRNCNVIIDNDDMVYCQSYNSIVAVFNSQKNTLILGRDWDYSITTLKHLYRFLESCVPRYAHSKKKDLSKLIESGEIDYSDMLN